MIAHRIPYKEVSNPQKPPNREMTRFVDTVLALKAESSNQRPILLQEFLASLALWRVGTIVCWVVEFLTGVSQISDIFG